MSTEQRLAEAEVWTMPSYPETTTTMAPAREVPRTEAALRAGSVAALRSLRVGLGKCLDEGGCDPDTVADAQLIMAEVVTNAFVHDAAPLVDVRITCDATEVTIATAHRGEVVPPPYPVQPAPVIGPVVTPGGRGLAIVDRLAVSRVVANEAGCTTTVVRLRR